MENKREGHNFFFFFIFNKWSEPNLLLKNLLLFVSKNLLLTRCYLGEPFLFEYFPPAKAQTNTQYFFSKKSFLLSPIFHLSKIASSSSLTSHIPSLILPSIPTKLYPSLPFKQIVHTLFLNQSLPHNPTTKLIKEFTYHCKFPQSIFIFKKLLISPFYKPQSLIFPYLFKSCIVLHTPRLGFSIHGCLIKFGFDHSVVNSHSLISLYIRNRKIKDAYNVFDEMPERTVFSYNFMIFCLGVNEFYEDVLSVFRESVGLGLCVNSDSVCYGIIACCEMRNLEGGISIHKLLLKNGVGSDVRADNLLISMYTKLGRLDLGRRVFDDMPERDLVSWNSMITGYAQNRNWVEVFDLFVNMKSMGNWIPSRVTFLGLVQACGQARNLNMGRSIHGYMIHPGLMSDFRLGTSILDMYLKCGEVESARFIFEEELHERSLVSWNSLLAGYAQNGCDLEAVSFFQRMLRDPNVEPDSITIANVVPACARLADLHMICSIHAIIIKKGLSLDCDIVLGTSMVDAYGKCLDVKAAAFLFTSIRKPSAAIWNAMISGYNLNHSALEGMELFRQMLHYEVSPDSITMVMLLQSCGEIRSLKQGSIIHGYCFSKGFGSHLTVENAMIDMYMRCGCIQNSVVLFNSMPDKNIVTWNTIMCGYVKIGYPSVVVDLFHQLQWENQLRPDSVTMISVIQAYAIDSTNHGSKVMHCLTIKFGFNYDTVVMNSLIDSYAKNGQIDYAWSLFEQMGRSKDNSSWNVMLAGFGMNGQGRKACSLFSHMEEDGYVPNSITFISLLSSCGHSGLINEGCKYFKLMTLKYNIQPCLEHWTGMIDMFGRAGRLEEAYQLIKDGLPKSDGPGNLSESAAIWGTLLSACRMHMNMELGEIAYQQLSRLAPQNCGYYTLSANLYASRSRFDDAEHTRKVFEDGKLLKKAGFSMVKA